jgi:hypothetical protein
VAWYRERGDELFRVEVEIAEFRTTKAVPDRHQWLHVPFERVPEADARTSYEEHGVCQLAPATGRFDELGDILLPDRRVLAKRLLDLAIQAIAGDRCQGKQNQGDDGSSSCDFFHTVDPTVSAMIHRFRPRS